MSQKIYLLVFVLLFAVSMMMACGGGGSSSAPLPIAAPDNGTGSPPPDSGSGPGNDGSSPGTATLAWDAPVTNEDGTALKDLGGYRVHYGMAPGTYSASMDVGKITSCSIGSLAPGTYYMTVTAYNASGAESSYSNEVSKTIL